MQAYNFRMCLTDVPENRVPFPKPAGYDPLRYELLLRYDAGRRNGTCWAIDVSRCPIARPTPTTTAAFSTDNIGMNYDYPDGDYATREKILQDHVTYQLGLMWFLANDPRVPENMCARDEPLGAGQGRIHRTPTTGRTSFTSARPGG